MMRQQQGQHEPPIWGQIEKALREGASLSAVLTPERVFPQDGWAYQVAEALTGEGRGEDRGMNPTQLRRFFGPIKAIAEKYRYSTSDKLDERDRRRILSLTPLIAYAVGRRLMSPGFFRILERCLTQQNLGPRDAVCLGEFLTAVVAWHKFLNPSRGG